MKAKLKAKVIAAAKVADLEILIVKDGVYAEQDKEKEKRFAALLERNGAGVYRTHIGSPFLPSFGKITDNGIVFADAETKTAEKPRASAPKSKAKTEGASAYSDGHAIVKGKRKTAQPMTGPGLFDLPPEGS